MSQGTRTRVPNLLTFSQFQEKHPWASVGGLRWQRFHDRSNGFAGVFVNVGRRVLIDEDKYFAVVERQNQGQVAEG